MTDSPRSASEKLKPFLGTAISGAVAALVACLFMATLANGTAEAPEMEHTAALPSITQQADPEVEAVLEPELVEALETHVPKTYTQSIATMPTTQAGVIPESVPLPQAEPIPTPQPTPSTEPTPPTTPFTTPESVATFPSTPTLTPTSSATPSPTPTPTPWSF